MSLRVSAVTLCLGWALACGGGETAEGVPEAPLPEPVPVERGPITPVPTGDPAIDAYLADCHAVLPPEDPQLGSDECLVVPELPPGEPDRYGCREQAGTCGTGCGTRCTGCQESCAQECDQCKERCEDSACLTWCSENRNACRLVCTRAQSECGRDCIEDMPRCEESAAGQLQSDCPQCDLIRECLKDRKKRQICREKYPENDERCFTVCAG